MGALKSEVFTYQLTSGSITITESMGLKQVCVFNGTSVTGTVLGGKTIGAYAPTEIEVEEKDSFIVRAVDASVIIGLTITAPLGCTLKIVAQ
jgi:hypothetical protein